MQPKLAYIFFSLGVLGANSQILPGYVQSQYPSLGAVDVPRNTAIAIRIAWPNNYSGDTQFTLRQKNSGANVAIIPSYGSTAGNIYTPASVLAPTTTYTFAASGSILTYEFDFTTGTGLDTTPPHFVSVSPDPTTQGVSPFGPFIFYFDEPLISASQAISVTDGAGNSVGDFLVTLSANQRAIEVRPLFLNWLASIVQVKLNPASVRDAANNSGVGSPITVRFLTSLVTDTTGPHLLGQFPESGETNVPLNAVPQLLFDRSLYQPSIGAGGIIIEARGATVPCQPQVTGSVVRLTGLTLLPNTSYRVRLTTLLLDANGIPHAPEAAFDFTTGTAPDPEPTDGTIVSPSTSRAPVNSLITLRSARRLPTFTPFLFSAIVPQRNGVPAYLQRPASARLLDDRRTLVITPRDPLPAWADIGVDLSAVTDITGTSFNSLSFPTSDDNDITPPALVSTSPSDGASGIPVTTTLRVLLNEPVGLSTPASSIRLSRKGVEVGGRLIFASPYDYSGNAPGQNAVDFKPASTLEPGADYLVELNGLADLAGNVMPPQTFQFRTADDSTPPKNYPTQVTTNVASGDLDSQEAIVLEYDMPLKAAQTAAAVVINVPRQYDSPLTFSHPVRVVVSGSTIRVEPLLPWPSGRDLTLSVGSEDIWGRRVSYYTTFRARPSGDTARPEVLSISPPAGTAISAGQSIRLKFSEPMLNASQTSNGITASQVLLSGTPAIYWSDDRTTATVVPFSANFTSQPPAPPLTIAVTSALVDLAGNSAKAFTARFPVIVSAYSPSALPQVIKSWPKSRDQSGVDRRSPISLYLSSAVDAAQLNQSLWVLTSDGRASGTWQVSAGGRLAVFHPDKLWLASSSVRLIQIDPVISLDYGFSFSTAAADPLLRTVVRTTLHDPQPANAAIDVEFSEDIPPTMSPLKLQRRIDYLTAVEVSCGELRVRPRTIRYVPRSPLSVGDYISLVARPGVNVFYSASSVKVAPSISPGVPGIRYRSPLRDSIDVPISARLSLGFSSELNELTVTESTIRASIGGSQIPVQFVMSPPSSLLTVTPLGPLPAGVVVDVKVDGVEDRFGGVFPAASWSFRTGDSVDVTGPTLLYSNGTTLMDPLAAFVLTFDEPLEPAQVGTYFAGNRTNVIWELSDDLRTVSVSRPGGWNRGDAYTFDNRFTDWSGNSASNTTLPGFRVGFDPDHTAPVLRATSIRDGQSGVPLTVTFALLFNKPLGADVLRSVRLTRDSGEMPLQIKQISGNRITLSPAYILDPLTSYQLSIERVKDASGNVLAEKTTIGFTTGEQLVEPSTQAVFRFTSTTSPLSVQFSRPIDITSLVDSPAILTWIDWRGGTGYTIIVPVTVAWTDDRRGLAVTPAQPLTAGTQYTLNLHTVSGSAGGVLSPPSFQFTAAESPEFKPTQVTFVPQDGSTNVPLNVLLQVTFSRSGDTTPAIRLYENEVPVAVTAAPTVLGGFTIGGSVTLRRTLKANQHYRIEVDGYRDQFDNDIPLTASSFTTGDQNDRTALAFVSSSPKQNEAGVALDAPWILSFNKPLLPLVFFDFGVQSSRAIPYRSVTQISGLNLTLRADPAWPAASTISLLIFPTTRYGVPEISDWTGGALSQQLSVSFRTAAANDTTPVALESAIPAAGSTIPGGKASVSLRFSKPVAIPDGALQIFFGAQKITASGVYSQDFRTVTYNLLPPANSTVTIVGTDAIRDNADNALEPFVLEYPTGETLPWGSPSVVLTEPTGYNDVPADSNVTLRFDRVMDSASVLPSIRVTQDGQNVAGSIEVLEAGRSYRFHPDAPYHPGASVRAFIFPSAKDPNGLIYQGEAGYFFIKAAASALSISQRGFHATAPADSTLEVEFSGDLNPETVNDSSVWLRRGTRLVSGQVALRDGQVVQFTPASPLDSGVEYVLTTGSALRDTDGRTFPGQDLRFRAVPAGEPTEIESVTETTWEGRTAVRLRFTRPVSPLAARRMYLDQAGTRINALVHSSTDQREFLVVPERPFAGGALSVSIENAPDANGRQIPFRRVDVKRTGDER